MLAALLIAVALPFACQASLVGGMTDITLDSDDVNVVFGLSAINGFYANNGDNAARTLVKVVKAQSQVVAGILYKVTLEVQSSQGTEDCDLKIWERSWLTGAEARQVTEGPTCKPAATKRAGGYSAASLDNEDVKNALSFAVDSINSQLNSIYLRKAGNVGEVTKQVVAGMHYKFTDVAMDLTTCTKGSSSLLENCAVSANNNAMTCSFDIYWQSWMTPAYTMQNLSC
jgi:hypothetical protein